MTSPKSLESYRQDFETFKLQHPDLAPADLAERQKILDFACQQNFPDAHNEAWKYTKLFQFSQQNFSADIPDLNNKLAEITLDSWVKTLDAFYCVFINGRWQPQLSSADIPAGLEIEILPMSHGGLLDCEIKATSVFTQLNQSFCSETVVIKVADGVHIQKPLYLLWLVSHEKELAQYPRKMMQIGAQSQLVIMEEYRDLQSNKAYCTNSVTEWLLEPKAQVRYYYIQKEAEQAYHFCHQNVWQKQQSTFEWQHFAFGAQLSRAETHVFLQEKAANFRINGFYALQKKQCADLHLQIHHQAPECHSEQYVKGVLTDQARGVFTGAVQVAPEASHTSARQMSKSLLLSKLAEADVRPQLIIEHDEVACSHGAAIGQLDEQALFYLLSRGIAAEQARAMLVAAFAQEIFARVAEQPLKQALLKSLQQLPNLIFEESADEF